MTAASASGPEQNDLVGPPPPFDPEVAEVLAGIAEFLPPAWTAEMIPLMRQQNSLAPPLTDEQLRRGGAFTVEERSAPGFDGAPDVPLLICRPTAAERPTAALYYLHGGGMVAGDNRAGISQVLDWAGESGSAVVSVDYRLAPETPHPGPIEDAYAGLVWTAAHSHELGIDPVRVVIVGESAGGGLAAGLALLARDRGGPAVFGQMLLVPMLDDRNDTISARQMASLGVWDRTANNVGWTALLGAARGGPEVSAYAAAARAEDLSGLPPAFIDVGSAEIFRDEAVAYASRIWAAGGVAELHVWPGACHGFDLLVPGAQISQDAKEARIRWVRRLLAP